MRIEFDRFYRERGMRTYAMLNTTRVWPIRDLPLNSVVHFLSEDENLFPDISSIYLKTTSKRVLLKNVLELLPENHSQSKVMFQPMNKVLEFIKANPNFINFLKPLSEAKEPTQLVFMNYNLVKPRYRYNESHRLTPYFKWLDKQKLMWSEINNCCGVSDRNHFIDFKVPKELPSKARLNMFSAAVTSEINKYFPTAQALFILDLWKWLDPATRENSALGSIDVRHLPKCNVLFHIEDGRAAVLNLGYLNSWVAGQPNTTDRRNLKGMAPEQLKLFFLKFLMNLQSYSDTPEEDADQEDDRLNGEIDNEDSGRNIAGRQTEEDLPLDDEEGDEEGTDGEDSFTSDIKGKSKKLAGSKKLSDVQGKDNGFKEGLDNDSEVPTTLLKKIEEETKALELLEERRLALKGEKKDEEIETEYDPDIQLTTEEVAQSLYKPREPKERLLERLDDAVSKGGISAADYRKILKSLEAQDTKPDPFGSNKTLKEMATLTSEDIQIREKDAALVGDDRVLDKSMLRSVVESLDRDYVRNTMKKDVISSIMAVQSAGVLVTDVQSETHHSKLGSFVSFTVTLKPIDGKSSTLRLKYPLVNEDGTFEANGVRYHMRKQRTDLPIRKIDAERVALSSYYGKLFVFRSPKKADSALSYICKHLTAASIGQIENITSVRPANVYDNNFKAPYIYNALAANYKGFTVNHEVFGELVFDFQNQTRLETLLPGWKGTLKEYESDGSVLVGRNKKGRPIIVDKHGHFKAILEHGDQPLGDIFDILSLNRLKAPVDPAMVKVMGRTLPVGVVMARAMGLKKLLKFTDARYRLVKGRQQKNLQPHEYVISFADYSLVLDRRDVRSSMIFGGFDVVHGAIKNFPIETFERKDVYDEVLDSVGAGVVVARELNLLETSYVDEITRNILIEMKEPQTFLGLLDRSCEMLLDYNTPDAQDFEHQQVRGYERFAGAIYRELMKSVRAFRNKNISGRSKVEMSPFAVWQGLMEDRSVKTCEDINPIQNLKMHESVTFAGEGGRDKDAFLKDARAMSLNDAGTFSEASVDSGDVGYNIFMSCNPHLKNLRGMRNEGDTPNEAGHYFSSSILNAVGAAHDDAKRNVFVSIQNAHVIACNGYRQPYVQTGYETVTAQRVDDLFCYTAKDAGKVISITKKAILVEYNSGQQVGVQLGRRYGNAEGSTYPHDIVPLLKEGDKFVKGDTIAFNEGFWEVDFLDPRKVVLKTSLLTTVAFEESSVTHEDSSAVSEELAAKLVSKTTKVKSYVVKFTNNLHEVVKTEQDVDPETVLMSIEDESTVGTGLFDAESSALLGKLSRMNPRAGYLGTVDKIEVLYHGDKADMSPSIKALADKSDRDMVETCKALGKPVINGRVSGDYRVAGKNLQLDHAEIKFYITVVNSFGVGDKTVFANQLKSTTAQTMNYKITTEDGRKVDAIFGGLSAIKRIVNSYGIEGTTTGLLQFMDKKSIELYES